MVTPVTVEKTYNAPVEKVWNAITDKNEMKKWYFDIPEFKAEPGFEFRFNGQGKTGENFLHICKITEVIKNKKLRHSWRYEGYEGDSYVTFELFDEGGKTRLRLTHEGLESFPLTAHNDFARENFQEGWTYIVTIALNDYVDPGKADFKATITFSSSPTKLFDCLTKKINEWWTEDFEGNAENFGDVFTVRFGETFKRFKIEDIVPDRKIAWYCLDAFINSSKLVNKSEWRGTRPVWEISQEGDDTILSFTHRGLTPVLECYEICEARWNEVFDSLRKYVATGKGVPHKKPEKVS
jgi:uncharacterized protein YndB with AHSA1/START domain